MESYILILRSVMEKPEITQRELAGLCGISLGKLNERLNRCVSEGYLLRTEEKSGRGRSGGFHVSEAGMELLAAHRTDCALILASGFGSRFVPLTYELPKGLLSVFGERMIERQIRQLQEAGIRDITIMVGYLKEKFDYLIDKYGVKLLYNPEYAEKNTLATLYHARALLRGRNCYILSSDNWLRENMYHEYEPHSWYAASFMEGETGEWAMSFSKNGRIREVQVGGRDAWCMYGPVYLSRDFLEEFLPLLEAYYRMPGTEQLYWEDVLVRNLSRLPAIYVNRQPEKQIYEFENLEELRQFDERYVRHSGSEAMQLTSRVLEIPESDIVNIRCLKAGMTNKSWLFSVREDSARECFRGNSYICRIPGNGTEKLISRREEAEVYKEVQPLGITEELIFFDADSGYKISRYYPNARTADFSREEDRRACMQLLRRLHESGIRVPHRFDLRERLHHYEELCRERGAEIPFEDYPKIRMQAEELLRFTEEQRLEDCICHIDSVKDNFLFTEEGLRMIDWEYAGMSDPMTDIGMSAIYSYMDYEEARELLRAYLSGERKEEERLFTLVTAYMGLGGLLWSLWCVYKISFGEKFGDYTLKMYRYFKNSYQILQKSGKI